MDTLKIYPATTDRGGVAKNQYFIHGVPGEELDGIQLESGKRFQSYDSLICHIDNTGQIFLDWQKWDYSKTTSFYLHQFTGLNLDGIRKGIQNKSIILMDLNSSRHKVNSF